MNLRFTFACALILSFLPAQARGDIFGFPLTLDDKNTTVTFEVDSTWHLVEGKTAGVSGTLALADPNDPSSVHGEIRLPVNLFDTDSSRRDTRMREVLLAESFPSVTFDVSSAELHCDGKTWRGEGSCPIRVHGTLNIRGERRTWSVAGRLGFSGERYTFDAEGSLRWPEFGVEDPSILVARLKPEVTIHIHSMWPEK